MLSVNLKGGLGNQLFQIAAGETISAEIGSIFCVENVSPKTVHSDTNYFTNVLSAWKDRPRMPAHTLEVIEETFEKRDWNSIRFRMVRIDGYFQNWRYVSPSFRSMLRLPPHAPLPGAFLHIRGGDYVNNAFHDVGLRHGYYQRAIARFPSGTHFYVFTNDVPYAKSLALLDNVPHTYMDSDEVTSLAQMAACTEGGICANSSFSWWGAFLNPTRTIIMPDKWFNGSGMYIEGYYFPGVQKCAV